MVWVRCNHCNHAVNAKRERAMRSVIFRCPKCNKVSTIFLSGRSILFDKV